MHTRSEDADQRLRFHCARQPPPHSSGSSSLFKMASIENRRGEDPGDEVAVHGGSASNVSTLDSVFNWMYAFPFRWKRCTGGTVYAFPMKTGGEVSENALTSMRFQIKSHWQGRTDLSFVRQYSNQQKNLKLLTLLTNAIKSLLSSSHSVQQQTYQQEYFLNRKQKEIQSNF